MSASEWIGRLLAALSGHPLLERLLLASLELVIVTAVVLAIIHIARLRSKRVVALMWLVVLAKPVAGLLAGSPAPIWNAASLAPAVATQPVVVVPAPPHTPQVSSTDPAASDQPLPAATINRPPDAGRVAKVVWFVGVAVMGMLSLIDRLRIRNLVAGATGPPPEISVIYERAAGGRGVRRLPRLLVTERLESPAIVGTVFPVVLLPRWMTHRRHRDRVFWSLRHELAHWRHGDPIAAFVAELSRVLFFFHPIAWWAGRRWKTAAEIACDQALVATTTDARRYAEQLYQILARVHTRRQIMLADGLFATRTQIGKRIELLLKSRPRRRTGVRVASTAFLSVFSVLVFSLGTELAPQADPGEVVVKKRGGDDDHVFATVHDDDGHETSIRIEGKVRFNDDRTDVASISQGGRLTVEDTRDGVRRSLTIEPSADGELEYEFEVDGKSRPFDDEAREWLARVLERIHIGGGTDRDVDPILVKPAPRVRLLKRGVFLDEHGDARIELHIGDPRVVADVYRDEDGGTIEVLVDEEDEDARVWISTSADAVGRSGDRVVIDVSDSGKLRITVKRGDDTHELEVSSPDGGEKEFVYRLNGEVRPYDDDAKKIFEKYYRLLENGLELHVKGERI